MPQMRRTLTPSEVKYGYLYASELKGELPELSAPVTIVDSDGQRFDGKMHSAQKGRIDRLTDLHHKNSSRPGETIIIEVNPEEKGIVYVQFGDVHTPRAVDLEDPSQPARVRQETYRILRDTALARAAKESHQYRCQICGQTLLLGGKTPYAEAHHIKPLGKPHDGPDVPGNILCVCPNDHVLLDYGAIKLDETRLDGIDKDFVDYHNKKIYAKILA